MSAFIASDDALASASYGLPQLLGQNRLYGSTLSECDSVADAVLTRHAALNGVVLARQGELGNAAGCDQG